MDKGSPTWATYRALMLGRLIGINKCPGVSRVVVGDTWWKHLAKCMLGVTGTDVKEA